MAKDFLKAKARSLRSQGISIKIIAITLSVSKSSVSWWVRDIKLSEIQKEVLKKSEKKGNEVGRLKSIQIRREKQAQNIERFLKLGMNTVNKMTNKELLLTGLALYWAEGTKSGQSRRVEFCNSDPEMIKLILIWLEKCFDIKKQDLRCVVGINEIHQKRDEIVQKYWSDLTGIPREQFRKTSFKKVINKKVYANYDNHFGTLYILVNKSTDLYYRIMGLIKGLTQSKIMAA